MQALPLVVITLTPGHFHSEPSQILPNGTLCSIPMSHIVSLQQNKDIKPHIENENGDLAVLNPAKSDKTCRGFW